MHICVCMNICINRGGVYWPKTNVFTKSKWSGSVWLVLSPVSSDFRLFYIRQQAWILGFSFGLFFFPAQSLHRYLKNADVWNDFYWLSVKQLDISSELTPWNHKVLLRHVTDGVRQQQSDFWFSPPSVHVLWLSPPQPLTPPAWQPSALTVCSTPEILNLFCTKDRFLNH